MGTVSLSLPSDGETIDSSDYNTPITTFVNEFNGEIDNANIASDAAIAGTKLADESVTNAKLAYGASVQTVYASTSAGSTGTTLMLRDDTIPQNTEGIEAITVAITPKSTTNVLHVRASVTVSSSIANNNWIIALFQDSTADAFSATIGRSTDANSNNIITIEGHLVTGTVSETTIKMRVGANGAGTTTINGWGGVRKLGAVPKTWLTVTEYKVA